MYAKKGVIQLPNNKKHRASKSQHYTVDESTTLLPFLLKMMPKRGRNSVKSIVERGQVSVDDHIETFYKYELTPGQIVSVLPNKEARREGALIGMKILYEDTEMIVIDKEAGLLSIANQKEKRKTAHYQLMNYVRKKNPRNRIYIVHRLDQDTSGVMMFAKSEQVKRQLQDSWIKRVKERGYLAMVEGTVKEKTGTITSWLKETKTHRMYSSSEKNDGQFAKTTYTVLQSNNRFSLLEVQLATGRKNQIRVHMQDLGHPVVGDKKYGAQSNPIRRLGLHAHKLTITHPSTNEELTFNSPAPKTFWADKKV